MSEWMDSAKINLCTLKCVPEEIELDKSCITSDNGAMIINEKWFIFNIQLRLIYLLLPT